MIISFIAIPGSGKTTQIRMLENYFNANEYLTVSVPGLYKQQEVLFPYLLPNEIAEIERVKDERSQARARGELAPIILDQIVFTLALRAHSLGKIVIMDGCPRGLTQATMFMEMLDDDLKVQYKIIELAFTSNPRKWSIERQLLRLREDPTLTDEEVALRAKKIPKKVEVFFNDTVPGLNYLLNQGVIKLSVNALDTRENIHEVIKSFLQGGNQSDLSIG